MNLILITLAQTYNSSSLSTNLKSFKQNTKTDANILTFDSTFINYG